MSQFCEICPEAALGYWGTGCAAWFKCWAAGRCERTTGLGVDRKPDSHAWHPQCDCEECSSMTASVQAYRRNHGLDPDDLGFETVASR